MRARAEAAGKIKHLRMSPEEIATVDRARKVNRQGFSEFARDAILTAAEECLERPRTARGRMGVMTPSGVHNP